MARARYYSRASMAALARDAAKLGIRHDTSLAATVVALPPLRFGAPFLQHWKTHQEPGGTGWQDDAYTTYSPWTFTFQDAVVHSAAGIVCVGDYVVEETLVHTDPALHNYRPVGTGGIWIDGASTALAGNHISVLSGGAAGSYHHAMIDGIGRMSVVPREALAASAGLLTSADPAPTVAWLQNKVSAVRTPVPVRGSLRVERLVLAGPNDSSCNYHPSLTAWFDRVADLSEPGTPGPRRFYIDRRTTRGRPLVNEADLIAALEPLGITPVAVETLAAEAQIDLFRNAELIVAPHGAGLANLVFAQAGCRVIELQSDAYCHWCFRRLAALKEVAYDCVLGRLIGPWPTLPGAVHAAKWQISIPHVVAAVAGA